MRPILEARGLTYQRGGRALVDQIDLDIACGEVTVIIGPNGAGKSTLVRLLSGEIRPSAGSIALEGTPLTARPAWDLACRRAVMPQASRIAFPFTAREIVRLGADGLGRGFTAAQRQAVVDRALFRADAHHLAARTVTSLSGGEQQRVYFARALAQLAVGRSVAERQVLFLDEPIASLDLKHQLGLLDEAAALAREGIAVIAVLHDLQLAADRADRLHVLHEGQLAASGRAEEVLTGALVERVFGVRRLDSAPSRFPWAMVRLGA